MIKVKVFYEDAINFISAIAGCPNCGSKSLKIERMLYIPNLMTTKLTIECRRCGNYYRLAFKDEVLWNIISDIERRIK
jgi:ribosomal protein L37E